MTDIVTRPHPCPVCGGLLGVGNHYCIAPGKKFDVGKPKLSLIPPAALVEIGKVLTLGAEKYAPGNWRKVRPWSRYSDAALRHLYAWLAGEDQDQEWGLSHLAHAGCCILFLLALQLAGADGDDRHELRGEEK